MEADGDTGGAKTFAALIARGKALMTTEPNYARFLLHAVRATDPDDLAPFGAAVMDAEFRRAYALLERRGEASHFIHVSKADVLTPDSPEILDIFSPDMPFIVDSVLAAIRAKGGKVRLMSHPVMPLDPKAFRVLNEPGPESRQESFLHLHIDPLADDAARQAMITEIGEVLTEVRQVVLGWRPMLERLRQVVQDLIEDPPPVAQAELGEDVQFLGWLANHNFTFLGLREYALTGGGEDAWLEPVAGSGVGLLENPEFRFLRHGSAYVEMSPQHRAFLSGPDLLLVTKANARSRVHRRSHLDYIGIKLFNPAGQLTGEVRIVGLFTSQALAAPNGAVPLIRRKVETVLVRSGRTPDSHAGKALLQALDTYPRDELFQIDADELLEYATAIAGLTDRPRVRVLPRIDRFDNFVSVLLFMPRDRYNSEVRATIGEYLARRYDGRLSAYYPHFPEGELVRVHFIIGRIAGETPRPAREDLEREVTDLTRSFGDRLVEAAPDPATVEAFRDGFEPAYEANATPLQALADIAVLQHLGDGLALHLYDGKPGSGTLGLRVYHRGGPIPLSERVPVLEQFGFRVIEEDTYLVSRRGGPGYVLHEMVLRLPDGAPLGDAMPRIEAALLAVFNGEAESDGFNRLTIKAGLNWDDVAIIRALGHYLRQLGLGFSQTYLAATLAEHAEAAAALIDLFHALNDPAFADDRAFAAEAARATVTAALERTQSLDEDRIIRRVLALVEAAVRTNFYQRDKGARRPALGIKFDCRQIAEMPEPKPYREIFVYAPRVEGLHLRFGPVARGGLRWSDRPEDFRTEVLGLVKAQQVKNAIIVPVGAKGAFVPKLMPPGADRETVQKEGIACYKVFVGTLLDLTDNIVGDQVVPPPDMVRRDGDDPYLVVAADKGTASFSDIANAIAIERTFWLGDAFASGGSVGYDHKKMGITARGAWEAVKRHFRELNRDIQKQPFSVVGVGDMSGDVFGNGMLLSPTTRLIAAFDHRDIFIDPDPDPGISLAERQRLFNLPRSSWQDYNRALLSKGGGVFPRGLKSVDLSPEARHAIGAGNGPLTPQDLVRAILRAEVDLLWFGGIGTYVRGASESNAEAGDKANDAVRITGAEIRAKVVGEGANLAMTEHGRVDYALKGGRLNTDAIDNSAGVNSSDLEVNIKIALSGVVASKRMSYEQRNDFLASMTGEVAELCLRNNYQQSLALSLAQRGGLAAFPDHRLLLRSLEHRGQLNRVVEELPDEPALDARALAGQGFTRPELAVLLAYAKNSLRADLLASGVVEDAYLAQELFRYFPPRLAADHADSITGHRLRREVIATVLANAMINRGGPAYVVANVEAASADPAQVTLAYAAVRDSFGLTELNRLVDLLDGHLPGATQLALYAEIEILLKRQTLWLLRNESPGSKLGELVTRYAQGVGEIRNALPTLLPPAFAQQIAARSAAFESGSTPRDLARRFAELSALAFGTDIVLVAGRSRASVVDAARAFFGVLDLLGLARILESAAGVVLGDRFDHMALDRSLANLLRTERELAVDVLAAGTGPVAERLASWHAARPEAIGRVIKSVADLTAGEVTLSRLAVAAGLLSDLSSGK